MGDPSPCSIGWQPETIGNSLGWGCCLAKCAKSLKGIRKMPVSAAGGVITGQWHLPCSVGTDRMKISRLDESPADFHLLDSTSRLQTATMLLRYGEATGEKPAVHQQSDQMVLLISGSLQAEIGSRTLVLQAGESLIVPAGVKHRFHNTEREAALAFTVYSPPAYPGDED